MRRSGGDAQLGFMRAGARGGETEQAIADWHDWVSQGCRF
jgi:hypothetical protein